MIGGETCATTRYCVLSPGLTENAHPPLFAVVVVAAVGL